MGTQKNHLNELVLLSTQNMLKVMGKKIFTFEDDNFIFYKKTTTEFEYYIGASDDQYYMSRGM